MDSLPGTYGNKNPGPHLDRLPFLNNNIDAYKVCLVIIFRELERSTIMANI